MRNVHVNYTPLQPHLIPTEGYTLGLPPPLDYDLAQGSVSASTIGTLFVNGALSVWIALFVFYAR